MRCVRWSWCLGGLWLALTVGGAHGAEPLAEVAAKVAQSTGYLILVDPHLRQAKVDLPAGQPLSLRWLGTLATEQGLTWRVYAEHRVAMLTDGRPPIEVRPLAASAGGESAPELRPGEVWAVLPLRWLRAGDAAALFRFRSAGPEPSSVGYFVYPQEVRQVRVHPLCNALSVVATPDAVNELRDLLKVLDLAPARIQFEAAAVALTVEQMESLSLNWQLASVGSEGLVQATGDLVAARDRLLKMDPRCVRRLPTETAHNGHAARLASGAGLVAGERMAPVVGFEVVARVTGQRDEDVVVRVPAGECLVGQTGAAGRSPEQIRAWYTGYLRVPNRGVVLLALPRALGDTRQTVLCLTVTATRPEVARPQP